MELGTLVARLLPVLSALALASLIEALIPLRDQSRNMHGRLGTNLALLVITLFLGLLLNCDARPRRGVCRAERFRLVAGSRMSAWSPRSS